MPSPRSAILTRRTPMSIEREFAFFHRNGRPLLRASARELQERLSKALGQASCQTEVVEEVAPNSLELKVCFSTVERIRHDIAQIYGLLATSVERAGIFVLGSSQPHLLDHHAEMTHFFTTDVFAQAAPWFAVSNSMHLHIGSKRPEDAIALYNAGNRIAPLVLALSQCAVIDGQSRGRAHVLSRLFNALPIQLTAPWPLGSETEYAHHLELARQAVEAVVRHLGVERIRELNERYPAFIDPSGRLLQLTPDKLFHYTRLRPDKRAPERGLWGSTEFRPIDGQFTVDLDAAYIELTLGLLAYSLAQGRGERLSSEERGGLMVSVHDIPDEGLGAVGWNGWADPAVVLTIAQRGMEEIGVKPRYLERVPGDGGEAEFHNREGRTDLEFLRLSHERFIASARTLEGE